MRLNEIQYDEFKNYDQKKINLLFIHACELGNFDNVKNFLTSPKLEIHADIHHRTDLGFRWACIKGHIDIVKYLLTSPELKEHADLHVKEDYGFKWAYENNHMDIIEFFILDLNIPKSKTIVECLTIFPKKEVETLFEIQQLNHTLSKNSIKKTNAKI